MKITEKDMTKYGHSDDWGVSCLYIHEVQAMLDAKKKERVFEQVETTPRNRKSGTMLSF